MNNFKFLQTKINEGVKRKRELPEFKVRLNPADCQIILNTLNINNRKPKALKINNYARDMKEGRWLNGTGNNICFAWDGRLINGQNRLSAVIKAGIPVEFSIKAGLDPRVQGVQDIGASRTVADTLAMANVKYSNTLSATASIIGGFLQNPYRPHSRNCNNPATKSELDNIALDNSEWFVDTLQQLKKLQIRNVIIESIALFAHYVLSHTEHSDKVDEFFEKLGIGADMSADDPVFVIRQRLMMNLNDLRGQKNKDSVLALIFKAWNMFIAEETTSNKMRTPTELPKISGLTSIDGIEIYKETE